MKREESKNRVHGAGNMDTYFIRLHVTIVPSHAADLGHSPNPDDAFQVKVGGIPRQLVCGYSSIGVR